MSTEAEAAGIRFEMDPVVFELVSEGSRDLRQVVLLVPKRLGIAEPVEVRIEPATTPNGFRFETDTPEWEGSSDDPDEPNRLRVRVVCSGGKDGMEDEAVLSLGLRSGATARVRLLAGINRVMALSDVLREEYRDLRPDLAEKLDAAAPPPSPGAPPVGIKTRQDEERVRQLYKVVHDDPDGLAALCFSGGGIRSATFNFGVLQGLASLGLLGKFHYLSTVSGGGYIGSWLSGWVHRAGAANVAPQLAGPQPSPVTPEPEPIRHLRQYSNYLNPKLGVLSADTWTLVAIVIRNMLLNALVILPILAALLTLPLFAVAQVPEEWRMKADTLFILAFVLGLIGLFFMNLLRASEQQGPSEKAPRWTRGFLFFGLLPLLAGTAVLVLAVQRFEPAGNFTFSSVLPRCAGWGLVMPLLAYLLSVALQKPLLGRRQASPMSELFGLVVAGSVVTLIYAGILSQWAQPLVNKELYLYAILGPGLVLGPLLLGKTFFIAFSSPVEEYAPGQSAENGDAGREWWARWSAWILIVTVVWIVGSALVYFAPFLLGELKAQVAAYIAAGGLGVLTSLLGKSSQTSKEGKPESPARQWILSLAAPLFCLVLLLVVSAGTQKLMFKVFQPEAQQSQSQKPPEKKGFWFTKPSDHRPFMGEAWEVLATSAALLGLGTLMGIFVNVNRFSLQGMYRNRLVRAYLGASNTKRRPNLFTGFDPQDNVRMHALRATNRPFHVVNMALNLVGGKELAWQQRKAESFTATPLHCGSASLGFRRSPVYGGQNGISLGTAVATSGAAANPNMGHHSSPPVTFIMTLFNARLGIWLGNPGKIGRRTSIRSGPRVSSRVVFEEALGMTDSEHPYINLSDGGHFENLGLYEMVRRRCRFIMVCDAGGDPDYVFEDLGNAIRKIRIDLGIPIDFDDRIHVFPKASKGQKVTDGARYGALGTIHYGEVDGPGAKDGTLLYIKPAICDTEPYDVTHYATASPTFPQETTADQWFSESQFESYRTLGKTSVLRMASFGPVSDLATFQQSAEKYVARAQQGTPKVEVILPGILAGLAAAGAPQLTSPVVDAPREGNGGTQAGTR